MSLSRLLNNPTNAAVTHETRPLTPWIADYQHAAAKFSQILERESNIVGDVAYSYLPYVEWLAEAFPCAKFVCMRRDSFSDVVDSLMQKTVLTNLWADHDGTEWELSPDWDPTMPTFPPMPKREAVEKYVTTYYVEAERLKTLLGGRFEIFATSSLNEVSGVRSIMQFCEIADNDGPVGIHENRLLS